MQAKTRSFIMIKTYAPMIVLHTFTTMLRVLLLLPAMLLPGLSVSAQTTRFPRVQVIEEATGTWCGWCVSLVVLLLRDSGVSIVNASRCSTIDAYVPDGIRHPELDSDPLPSSRFPRATYDLQGHRLDRPSHGLSIQNGRKQFVR